MAKEIFWLQEESDPGIWALGPILIGHELDLHSL